MSELFRTEDIKEFMIDETAVSKLLQLLSWKLGKNMIKLFKKFFRGFLRIIAHAQTQKQPNNYFLCSLMNKRIFFMVSPFTSPITTRSAILLWNLLMK
jgi:hypothetical protein